MRITKKVDTENMKGSITYEMLPYQARVKKVQDVYSGINLKTDAPVSEAGTVNDLEKEIEVGTKISVLVSEQAKHVSILATSDDGTEFPITTIEELSMIQEGVALINEVGTIILNGYQLGNGKKVSSDNK